MIPGTTVPLDTKFPITLNQDQLAVFTTNTTTETTVLAAANKLGFYFNPQFLTFADLDVTKVPVSAEGFTYITGTLKKEIGFFKKEGDKFIRKGHSAVGEKVALFTIQLGPRLNGSTLTKTHAELYNLVKDPDGGAPHSINHLDGGRRKRTPRKRRTIRKRTIKHKKH